MSGIFIDTNIFYNILFKTDLTEIVIATTKYYRNKGLAKGRWDLRKVVSEHGYPKEIASSILGLIEDLEVHVIPEPSDYREMRCSNSAHLQTPWNQEDHVV